MLDATLVAIAEHGLVPSVQVSRMTQFDRHPAGVGPNGERTDTPFYAVNYDSRLRPTGATLPINA